MRPLLLKVKGFTSFRDEQELNFEGLDLFAIAGPTGSGKSSLLDAMTYALFGWVERVGKQVSQLVSQGQGRMTVMLDFAAGDEIYRVTRSTPSGSGATKVILQRRDGDEWVTAGEDTDKVSGANKKIVDVIGLDYDAFTRSVLLPQGKFAEFLVGEAAKRREILTELLGLSLFKRMAQRAGEIGKEAKQKAETTAELVEREYEGVTEDALAAARASVESAVAREESLTKAGAAVKDIADRWRATKHVVGELTACARDARDIGGAVTRSAEALDEHARVLAGSKPKLQQASEDAKDAALAAEKAGAAVADAEGTWGTAPVLAEARAKAEQAGSLAAEVATIERTIAEIAEREPKLSATVEARTAALQTTTEALASSDADLERARDEYRAAIKTDSIATACDGLHAGDPCPVCGSALPQDPPTPSKAAQKAEELGNKLSAKRKTVEGAVRAAEKELATAERDLAEARKEVARLRTDLAKRTEIAATTARAVAVVFGGKLPADPVAALTERLDGLASLAEAHRVSVQTATTAASGVQAIERSLAEVHAKIQAERARLETQPVTSLLERARAAAGPAFEIPTIPTPAEQDDPTALVSAARATADALDTLAGGIDEAAARHGAGEQAMLAEAKEVVGDLLPLAPTFEALLVALETSSKSAAADAAGARKDVEMLAARLVKRAEMAKTVEELGARADRFRVLAKELQANNLIAFLQTEALQMLCLAGTAHLASLTDGRYRLVCEDDEFLVVDTWNAEEKRSVKTLSGGETFMASLALALALCEQVQSLSVGRKARLDSLFLDEGFGTLDVESLEEVVQAIEHLGGEGRMVGVITHIAELADRLPAKIMIEKSQRGSTVVVGV